MFYAVGKKGFPQFEEGYCIAIADLWAFVIPRMERDSQLEFGQAIKKALDECHSELHREREVFTECKKCNDESAFEALADHVARIDNLCEIVHRLESMLDSFSLVEGSHSDTQFRQDNDGTMSQSESNPCSRHKALILK